MKTTDPLIILTYAVSAGFLLLLARAAITGELNESVLSVMATIIGGLVAALSTRKKDAEAASKKQEVSADEPQSE